MDRKLLLGILLLSLTLTSITVAASLSTFYVKVRSEISTYDWKFNMSYYRTYAFFEAFFSGILLDNGTLIKFNEPVDVSNYTDLINVTLVNYGKDFAYLSIEVNESVKRLFFGIRHRWYDEILVVMRDLRNYARDFMYMDTQKERKAVVVTYPYNRITGNYTAFRFDPSTDKFELLIAFYVQGPAFVVILFPLFFTILVLDAIYLRKYLKKFLK